MEQNNVTRIAGLGIAIPLATAIGAAFMRTGEAAEKSADGVETLEDRVKALSRTIANSRLTLDSAFRHMSPEVFALTSAIEEQILEVTAARNALAETQPGLLRQGFLLLTDPMGAGDLDRQAAQIELNRLIERQNELEEELTTLRGVQRDQRRLDISETLSKMAEEAAFSESLLALSEEQAESATRRREVEQEILSQLESIYGTTMRLNDSEREAIDLLIQQEDSYRTAAAAAERLAEALAEASDRSLDLRNRAADIAQSLSIAANFAPGSRAQDMALGAAEAFTESMRGLNETGLNFLSRLPIAMGDAAAQAAIIAGELDLDVLTTAPSGSSQGDVNRASALAQSLMSEQEVLDIWREDSLASLVDFNARELAILEAHGGARTLIEEEYQSRLREIRNAERANTLSGYGDLFGALGSLMGNSGRKLLQIQAGLSAAATMISTYEGAARQAAKASNPIAAGAIWASWIARGVAAVAKIKQIGSSGNASGGGGGGGGAGGIATPDGSGSGPQKILIEGLNPGDMLSGEMLKELFDKIYDENDNRGAVFMVST